MPETIWTVRWPDGAEEALYSPSSVVGEFFEAGGAYSVAEFLSRARDAMARASDRVEHKYGYACSSAMAQLDRIEARIARLDDTSQAQITCLSITREGRAP